MSYWINGILEYGDRSIIPLFFRRHTFGTDLLMQEMNK